MLSIIVLLFIRLRFKQVQVRYGSFKTGLLLADFCQLILDWLVARYYLDFEL